MKTLQITEANARRLYKDSTPEFRTTLEDTFGKGYFARKVTDCETYEEVCSFIGEVPVDETELIRIGFTQDEICYRKLKTIIKALNEGWSPDWTDRDERKWFPYFNASSGFAFSAAYSCYSCADAGSGSRFCFKTEALASHAGRQFADLFKGFIF